MRTDESASASAERNSAAPQCYALSSVFFAAILFYEWCGNTPGLADATLVSSYYLGGFSLAVILAKLGLLCFCRRWKFALGRLWVIGKAILVNLGILALYALCRAFSQS